jgi:hypothetical protein
MVTKKPAKINGWVFDLIQPVVALRSGSATQGQSGF